MARYVIGVDIGTMGTKTGIYDEDGRLCGTAYEESKLYYPKPGWVEQINEEIYGSAIRTIRAAMEQGGIDPKHVAAIAFDGQMAGLSTVGEGWSSPTEYDSWLDNRCAAYLPRLKEIESEIIASAGSAPAYNAGPKMLYWKHEHPEIWQKIVKFTQPAAYVAGRLAKLPAEEAFIDRTYLVFSCFGDTRNSRWNEDLIGRFDIDPKKLPRILDPWEVIGKVSRDAAAECGLLEGTPIAAGCGDQAANVLGAGIVDPGSVYDAAGTASIFATVLDGFATDTAYKALMTSSHVVPGLYFAMAYVAGGGLNTRWFRDEFCGPEKSEWTATGRNAYEVLGEFAATVAPGSEKLVFIPHLGGRNTPNDTDMRGAFIGLTWAHRKPHLYRAILESIGYEYALYLQAVRTIAPQTPPKEVISIGGGARSRVFKQIKADILGLPYSSLDREEYGTLGAAIVAGKAAGLFPDMAATAKRFVNRSQEVVEPDRARNQVYRPYVELYEEVMANLKPSFAKLARM
ncbi:FGGY family carbohydrate kinase [Chelativorans sp.]|uniref:FGGY-family carbohydrate kinase n=1 Tax=Chelativorans sp. TaxID=2203393 RepID=UPI002811470F|nr:FGGY family carbohydrate kinase [Chelativorans sp.]